MLRSLPPLAKKYVLQLLYIDGPVSAKLLEEWVLPDGVSKHKVAVDRLIQLRIFTETVERYCTYNLIFICTSLVMLFVFLALLSLLDHISFNRLFFVSPFSV